MAARNKPIVTRHGIGTRRTTRILLSLLAFLVVVGTLTGIARAETTHAMIWPAQGIHPLLLTLLIGLFAGMTALVAAMFRRALREQARFARRID